MAEQYNYKKILPQGTKNFKRNAKRGLIIEPSNIEMHFNPKTFTEETLTKGGAHKRAFDAGWNQWGEYIKQQIQGTKDFPNISPEDAAYLFYHESSFGPNNMGQLTGSEWDEETKRNPKKNIRASLKRYQDAYNRVSRLFPNATEEEKKDYAFVGYNSGEGPLQKYGGVPPFPITAAYVLNRRKNTPIIAKYINPQQEIRAAITPVTSQNIYTSMQQQIAPAFRPDATKAVRPQLNQWVKPLPGAGVRVENPDGTFSSEVSRGVEIDGREYIIPSLIQGVHHSDESAIEHARQVGWDKFPNFADRETAKRYSRWRTQQLGIQGGDK